MRSVKERIDLSNQLVLVTGAGGTIGRVMCHNLAELGAELIMIEQQACQIDDLASAISDRYSVNVRVHYCDLEYEDQRTALIEKISAEHVYLHCLVNNAALGGTSDLPGWAVPFEEQTVGTWRRALEVNLTAAYHLSSGLIPLLRRSDNASIINIASIYGALGPDWSLYAGTSMANPVAYAASKGGLIQLTRWLATTMAPHVRANSISPGGVIEDLPAVFIERYEMRTPMRRMCDPDEVAGAVVFLASRLASYVTGHNLFVDGGWGAW